MLSGRLVATSATLLVLALIAAPSAGAQTSFTITLKTDASSYSGAQTLVASGVVSPAPGPNTAVLLQILSPSGARLAIASADVNGTTGSYQHSFVLGGTSGWVAGTYTLAASWGYSAIQPTVNATATFTYSPSTTTTTTTSTTTTSSTTSTTTTSTTRSTTSSTTTTTTSSTSTTTTTPPPIQTTTTSTSTSSTATPTSGGGIPEFPFQLAATSVFAILLVVSYLLVRRYWVSTGAVGRPR